MKILKPGDEGYGYLVEFDSGFISSELTCQDGVCSNHNLIKEFKSGLSLGKDGSLPDKIEIYAVLQKWGVENKNGRVYPEDILKREAKRYQEFIDMGTSLGELNHPESSIIDADRVSHRITEIWWNGRTLMGKMELDTTPGYLKSGIISSVGDKVLNMIRKGWTVGISSRGVGSLKNENGWDIVTSPSTPGSWISTSEKDLSSFMESTKENKDNLISEDNSSDLLDNLNKFLL
jgi:hypothetical protein